MATQKSMLSEFAWDQRYRIDAIEDVLTPAIRVGWRNWPSAQARRAALWPGCFGPKPASASVNGGSRRA